MPACQLGSSSERERVDTWVTRHREGARVPGLGRWAFQAVLIITSPRPTTQHLRTQRGKCYSFATSHNTGREGGGGGPKHGRGQGWGRGRARVPGLGHWALQAVLIITSPRPTTQHHRTQRGKRYLLKCATRNNIGKGRRVP